jgi:hypothetical protein
VKNQARVHVTRVFCCPGARLSAAFLDAAMHKKIATHQFATLYHSGIALNIHQFQLFMWQLENSETGTPLARLLPANTFGSSHFQTGIVHGGLDRQRLEEM